MRNTKLLNTFDECGIQVQMYYRSGTGGCGYVSIGQTLHIDSPGGSTFLRHGRHLEMLRQIENLTVS